ncbi:molybdate ABC transporter substrate-binding protein [Granulicella sp. L60]|uniref:molybdate ABC transporter substrate-binding protein n=1 Tax=Granulicella sp. L60 TaxID=1641866 RepID=UPI0020B12D00|nr:molybdate ABC transporter substrate-binding protein [Granulicella sp. L60]
MSLLSLVLTAYRKGRNASAALAFLTVAIGLASSGTNALGQQKAQQKELRIAAAADLQPVLPVLADQYLKATGVKLIISFGSSATLATQIQNGAPIDLFMSADFVTPEKIVAAGLADGTAPTPYAKGSLVLWTRKDSGLLPLSMERLTDPKVKTIAIANELHAPYGRAAADALRRMKIFDQVSPHFVIGENITQTAQFAESGNAQLGLISLTTASTPHFKEIGTYVLVPTNLYNSIQQCAVVIGNSDRKAEAHAFLNWVLSSQVQNELSNFGLGAVQ